MNEIILLTRDDPIYALEKNNNILAIDQTGLGLDVRMGKLFDQYYIKDQIEIERDLLLERVCDPLEVIVHE